MQMISKFCEKVFLSWMGGVLRCGFNTVITHSVTENSHRLPLGLVQVRLIPMDEIGKSVGGCVRILGSSLLLVVDALVVA